MVTVSDASVERALRKIDRFSTFPAGMGAIKLVGENLLAFTACGAFTGKGFQILKRLITGAVLGCRHRSLLD
jgi:hypothetical protein